VVERTLRRSPILKSHLASGIPSMEHLAVKFVNSIAMQEPVHMGWQEPARGNFIGWVLGYGRSIRAVARETGLWRTNWVVEWRRERASADERGRHIKGLIDKSLK
jgi:hypothetical protein